MSYLYKAHCYDTTTELHAVVAADCPLYTDGAKILQCTPTQTGIDMSIYDIASQSTQTLSIVPKLIECAPDLTSTVDLSWKIVLAFVVAWGIKQLANTVRMTT